METRNPLKAPPNHNQPLSLPSGPHSGPHSDHPHPHSLSPLFRSYFFHSDPKAEPPTPLAATDMWALTPNSGGSSCLPARRTPPPLAAAGEAGSLAAGPGRWCSWRRRQPAERWPKLAVSASGRKSKGGRDEGGGDEPKKNKAASSSSSGRFSRSIETDGASGLCVLARLGW